MKKQTSGIQYQISASMRMIDVVEGGMVVLGVAIIIFMIFC